MLHVCFSKSCNACKLTWSGFLTNRDFGVLMKVVGTLPCFLFVGSLIGVVSSNDFECLHQTQQH